MPAALLAAVAVGKIAADVVPSDTGAPTHPAIDWSVVHMFAN